MNTGKINETEDEEILQASFSIDEKGTLKATEHDKYENIASSV
jgi:hypothetical protein